jgi:hypothetical protein
MGSRLSRAWLRFIQQRERSVDNATARDGALPQSTILLELASKSLGRRQFLGGVSGITAATASVGVIGLESCSEVKSR